MIVGCGARPTFNNEQPLPTVQASGAVKILIDTVGNETTYGSTNGGGDIIEGYRLILAS
jgi:hypothetical protein